jgi:hypothetical protein
MAQQRAVESVMKWICGGQNGVGAGFSQSTSVSPAKTIHSTNFSIITISVQLAEALRRADHPSEESGRLS